MKTSSTCPIAVQYTVTIALTLTTAALITGVALLLISKIGTTGSALFGSGAGALVLALGIGSVYMISKAPTESDSVVRRWNERVQQQTDFAPSNSIDHNEQLQQQTDFAPSNSIDDNDESDVVVRRWNELMQQQTDFAARDSIDDNDESDAVVRQLNELMRGLRHDHTQFSQLMLGVNQAMPDRGFEPFLQILQNRHEMLVQRCETIEFLKQQRVADQGQISNLEELLLQNSLQFNVNSISSNPLFGSSQRNFGRMEGYVAFPLSIPNLFQMHERTLYSSVATINDVIDRMVQNEQNSQQNLNVPQIVELPDDHDLTAADVKDLEKQLAAAEAQIIDLKSDMEEKLRRERANSLEVADLLQLEISRLELEISRLQQAEMCYQGQVAQLLLQLQDTELQAFTTSPSPDNLNRDRSPSLNHQELPHAGHGVNRDYPKSKL